MPTADETLIDGIPAELGEATNASLVAFLDSQSAYWLSQSNVIGVPYRQMKVAALNFLIASYKTKADYREGNQEVKASQIVTNLLKLRDVALKDLEMWQAQAISNRGGTVGLLTHQAPVETNGLGLDPNDRAYRGDVLRRSGRLI